MGTLEYGIIVLAAAMVWAIIRFHNEKQRDHRRHVSAEKAFKQKEARRAS